MKYFSRLFCLLLCSLLVFNGCGPDDPGDTAEECVEEETLCDDVCVDTSTEYDHCGACGTSCDQGEICSSGSCEVYCKDGLINCDGTCIDPDTDRNFCGAGNSCEGDDSGESCIDGELCSAGSCEVSCQQGLVECDGICINPESDRDYCGASDSCEDDEAGSICAEGQICEEGACELSCAPDEVKCNGVCINPEIDRGHCGASNSCEGEDSGESCINGELCSGGSCEVSCQQGLVECGGICINPESDRAYCGASDSCQDDDAGSVCADGQVCVAGACEVSCPDGQIECGGTCIDPEEDRNFCGATSDCTGANVGTSCSAGQICEDGACALTCADDQSMCDGQCVDTDRDADYCGSCTNSCDADEVCSLGQCALQCGGGTTKCSNSCVDTRYDPNHCGSCDVTCPEVVNAVPTCADESCSYVCESEFANCNHDDSDGCEIKIADDANNCGACGVVCPSGGCLNGACVPPKTVFVTSEVFTGNMGGISGADASCQSLADDAGLSGTFLAWLSDSSVSPSSRFTRSTGSYELVNGVRIADNWTDLTDLSIQHPINLTEHGDPAPEGDPGCSGSTQAVFSNTSAVGTSQSGSCSNWTSTSGDSHSGRFDRTSLNWTTWCTSENCDAKAPIYCFEQ